MLLLFLNLLFLVRSPTEDPIKALDQALGIHRLEKDATHADPLTLLNHFLPSLDVSHPVDRERVAQAKGILRLDSLPNSVEFLIRVSSDVNEDHPVPLIATRFAEVLLDILRGLLVAHSFNT